MSPMMATPPIARARTCLKVGTPPPYRTHRATAGRLALACSPDHTAPVMGRDAIPGSGLAKRLRPGFHRTVTSGDAIVGGGVTTTFREDQLGGGCAPPDS